MVTFIQFLITGLRLGSVYALIAFGYTMVYGIIKLINFAHGGRLHAVFHNPAHDEDRTAGMAGSYSCNYRLFLRRYANGTSGIPAGA